MIKATEEMVSFNGMTTELLVEFTEIIRGLHSLLERDGGDEYARENIYRCARIAYMDDEELQKTLKNGWGDV